MIGASAAARAEHRDRSHPALLTAVFPRVLARWKEYAARKNDEEEEHVADTLLYDERCHLPRSAPRPDVVPEPPAPPVTPVAKKEEAPAVAVAKKEEAEKASG